MEDTCSAPEGDGAGFDVPRLVRGLRPLIDRVDRLRQMLYLVTAQSHYRAKALLTHDDHDNDQIAQAKADFLTLDRRVTTSAFSAGMRSSAAAPSANAPTTSRRGWRLKWCCRSARYRGSSSTIATLIPATSRTIGGPARGVAPLYVRACAG